MFDIETEPSDLDVDGERVEVYRNLQDDCLSIKSAEPKGAGSTAETQGVSESRNTDSDDYGNVIGHANFVLLSDVEFVIQDSGQERARETCVKSAESSGRSSTVGERSEPKNVHAVVRGTVKGVDADAEIEWNMMVRMFGNDVCNVTYDLFETDQFEIEGTPRVEEHDVSVGDPIYEATYASVTEAGVGAMLPSLS